MFELIELKKAYNQENEYEIMNAIFNGPIPSTDLAEDFNLILEWFKIKYYNFLLLNYELILKIFEAVLKKLLRIA